MLHIDMVYFACRDRSMPPEEDQLKKKIMNPFENKTQTDRKIADALGKTSS